MSYQATDAQTLKDLSNSPIAPSLKSLPYGGPKGRVMHQYLSDSIYATIDNIYVTIDDNYAMVDNCYAMILM